MAVYEILPTENLKWDDIRDTLNANNGSVTNVAETAFKATANINKWSKYKPVRLNENFPSYDTYYTAQDGLCGFGGFEMFDQISLFTVYRNKSTWKYLLPRGGSNEPYRLGYFRGYYTKAKPFLRSKIQKGTVRKANTAGVGTVTFTFDGTTDANSIQLSDFYRSTFYDLKNAKLSAIICSGDPIKGDPYNIEDVQTGDKVSGNNSPSIVLNCNAFSNKNLTVIFALQFQMANTTYMTLPGADEDEKNYFMATVKVVNDPMFGANAYLTRIGFRSYGSSDVNTPLTEIRTFSPINPSHVPFKITERGEFQLEVQIDVPTTTEEGDNNSYTIYTADQFMVSMKQDGMTQASFVNNISIATINGVSPTFPYTVKKGGSTKIVLKNYYSDVVISQFVKDGATILSLIDKRYQNESALSTSQIMLDVYPFK